MFIILYSENTVAKVEIDKNASSCVMEVCQVWFNFAAPPLTPITRKIDYTRYSYNPYLLCNICI